MTVETFKKIRTKVYCEELPNGLKIYMIPDKKFTPFYCSINVGVGNINTSFKKPEEKNFHHVPNGTAHYLEHILHQMPDNIDIKKIFSKYGVSRNASTSFYDTWYYVSGRSNFLECFETLISMVFTPYFTDEMIAKEREIILSEANSQKNNPFFKAYIQENNQIYINAKEKYLVAGTVDDIKSITKKDVKLLYDYFYHPKNMFIVVCGNFNMQKTLEVIHNNKFLNKKYSKNFTTIDEKINEPGKVSQEYGELHLNIEAPDVKVLYKINESCFSSLKLNDEVFNLYLLVLRSIIFSDTRETTQNLLEKKKVDYMPRMMISHKKNGYVIISMNCQTHHPDEMIETFKEIANN